MEQTFDLILKTLLERYEQNKNNNIEETISEIIQEMGMSEECQNEVREATQMIDSYANKQNSLQEARENDQTRQRWLMNQIDASLTSLTDDNKVLALNAIEESLTQTAGAKEE